MPNGTKIQEEELIKNPEVQTAPNPPLNTNEKSEDEAPSWFDKAKSYVSSAIDARNQSLKYDLYKPKTLEDKGDKKEEVKTAANLKQTRLEKIDGEEAKEEEKGFFGGEGFLGLRNVFKEDEDITAANKLREDNKQIVAAQTDQALNNPEAVKSVDNAMKEIENKSSLFGLDPEDKFDLDESVVTAALQVADWRSSAKKAGLMHIGMGYESVKKNGVGSMLKNMQKKYLHEALGGMPDQDEDRDGILDHKQINIFEHGLTTEEKLKVEADVEQKMLIDYMSSIPNVGGFGGAAPPVFMIDEAMEENQSKMTTFLDEDGNPTDIASDLMNGRFLQAGQRSLNGAISSAPSLAAAYAGPVGLAAMGVGMYGTKFTDEFDENPDEAIETLMFNSAATAGTEVIGGLITQKLLFGSGIFPPAAGKAAVANALKPWTNKVKDIVVNGYLGEGAEEWTQAMVSDYIDHVTLSRLEGQEFNFLEKAREKMDEGIIGGFTGGKMKTVTTGFQSNRGLKNRAMNVVMPTHNLKSINDKVKEANELQLQKEKATTPEAKDIIKKQIKEKGNEIKEERRKIENNFDNLLKSKQGQTELIEMGNNLDQMQKLTKSLKREKDGNARKILEDNIKKVKQRNSNLFNNATKRRLQENIATARKTKGAKNVKVHTDPKNFQQIHDEITGGDPKKSMDVTGVDGFYVGGVLHINKAAAINTNAVTVGSHELLHDITKSKLNDVNGKLTPDGKKLIDGFREQLSTKENNVVQKRIDASYRYNKDGTEKKYDEYAEEYLNVFHDAVNKGDIKYTPTDAQWWKNLGDSFIPTFKTEGYDNIKFETGKDVYNFMKDYNKDIDQGVVRQAIKDLAKQPQVTKGDVKLSNTASDSVQKIYEQQGSDGIMDILNEYTPMVNNIVNKYQNVPGFDRQMLTDEINTGKRGIYDLVREYKPEKGVPLAAYINKYLKARAIEAANRVLKTEFEVDIADVKDVAVKEETIADKKPKKKIDKVSKKVLSKEFQFEKILKAITKLMKDKNFKMPDSYKSVKDITPALTAELFGVNPDQYVNPKKSLKKEDVIAARTFIRKNAELLYNMLPESLNEQGKSTGIRKLLLDNFYKTTGVRKESALGRSAQGSEVRIKQPFNQAEFLKAFGIVKGEVMKVKNQTQISGMIKAMMNETGKAMTNQAIKKNLDPQLQKEAIQKIDDGKSRILYSDTQATKALDNIAERLPINKDGTTKMVDFLTTKLAEVLPYKLIIRSSNLAAAGNDALRALDRGFRFIGNFGKTRNDADRNANDPNKKEDTYNQLEAGNVADVEVVIAKASETTYKGNPDVTNKREAIRAKNRGGLNKNIANLEIHKKGVKEILTRLRDLYKKYPSQVRELLYNPNANANFNRDFASLLDVEANPKNGKMIEEHVFQAGRAAVRTLEAMGKSDKVFNNYLDWLVDNYYQIALTQKTANIVDKSQKAKDAGWDAKNQEHPLVKEALDKAMKNGDFSKVPSPDIRYFNKYHHINPNTTGYAGKYNVKVDSKYHNNPDVIEKQAEIINRIASKQETVADPQAEIDSYIKGDLGRKGAKKVNISYSKSVNENMSNKEQLDRFRKIDKALEVARNPDAEEKGISIFDFDQTLANTKENVLYTMPDGKKGKLTAKEFAEKAEQLELDGAEFDFKQFEKVKGATKGPFFDLAQKIKGKFGNENIFILTARPQSSDVAIQSFLKSIGLDIKIENITGLENGTPNAKSNFVIDKVADGYNNFFFGDDAYANVKAVQQVLDVVDVKRDVQQARIKFSKSMDTEFNKIIQENTGLSKDANVSLAKAKLKGAKKGNWFKDFFIPPSAEDFSGLLYGLLGKGKKGESQWKFFQDTLIRPFARGIKDLNAAKQIIANEFAQLKKTYPEVRKALRKDSPVKGYNNAHAMRVYLWAKNNIEIPGLSKTDQAALVKYVESNPDMKAFADKVSLITKLKEGYIKPDDSWLIGNIDTDMLAVTNKVGRAQFLQEFLQNAKKIFTEKNLNKLEAQYGSKYVEAMRDILYRMRYGTNRQQGQNRLVNTWSNWVNNSVGAIMFFNVRSAILQTLSITNFVNWSDNNILAAGKAFANQPQFWKDFSMIFNHPTLKQRRSGLQTDINANEIAERVANSNNPVSSALAWLLQKGFLPTQMADSFAISMGGASMYRNRVNTYLKKGFTKAEAENKAFIDFQEVSESTQQSARPDMISQQQAGPLGRLVQAFQNTPMQYARLMKKSFQDLANGRGDAKTHISKIIYYGAVQNLVFNAMQSALFAIAFGGDDDEEMVENPALEKKAIRIANGMADSVLRGLGVGGAVVATVKNMVLKFLEQEKKGYRADHAYTMMQGLNISPPIGSKARKIYSATQTYKFNRDEVKEMGFDIDNPGYDAVASVISGTTNVPLDRVLANIDNVRNALDKRNQAWQRMASLMGWNAWDLNIPDREVDKVKRELKQKKAREKKFKAKIKKLNLAKK